MTPTRFASALSTAMLLASTLTGCSCSGARTGLVTPEPYPLDAALPLDAAIEVDAPPAPPELDAGPRVDAAGSDTECDDGNECTDDVLEHGRCAHRAVADGQRCDDGRFCTVGDSCRAGACESGRDTTGPVAVEGRLHSFGDFDGIAIPLGDERFVFIDSASGTYATLVRLGDEIEVLDRERLEDLLGLTQYVARASIGGGRFAYGSRLIGESHEVLVASTDGDRIRPAHRFATGLLTTYALAGAGDRLWVCGAGGEVTGVTVAEFDLAASGGPREVARVLVPGGQCRSLEATPDGTRVYVGNGRNGLSWIDTSGPAPVLRERLSTSYDARLGGDLVAVLETDRVRVIRVPDHVELASIPGAFSAAMPLDGRVVVYGTREPDSASDAFVQVHDPLAPAGATLVDEIVVRRDAWRAPAPDALVGDGGRIVVRPLMRIFELGGAGLRELRHPAHGSLSFVDARGGEVHVRSAFSAHRVDVRDPRAPVFVAGGLHHAPHAAVLEQVSPRRLWPLGREPADDPSMVRLRDSATIHRQSFDGDALPSDLGAFDSERGSYLAVSGDHLYSLALTSNGAQLSRVRIADVEAGRDAPAQRFDLGAIAPDAAPSLGAFAIDSRARVALVALSDQPSVRDDPGARARIFWIDLDDGHVESHVVPEVVYSVAVRGDRAVLVVSGEVVAFWQRGAGEVARTDRVRGNLNHVLGFDGEHAYLGYLAGQLRVVRFGATSLADAPSFDLSGTPISMATTDTGLVVGSELELVTLRPACE